MKGLYGMDFMGGYTEGGVPYGTFIDEDETEEVLIKGHSFDANDKLPF